MEEGEPIELLPLLREARARRPWLARVLDPAQEPPLSHAGFSEACLAAVRAIRKDKALKTR